MDSRRRRILKNALDAGPLLPQADVQEPSSEIAKMDAWKYLIALFSVLLLTCANSRAETSRKIEIRFCPGSGMRSYPLNAGRELQSVLLQNAAVINYDTTTFKIENMVIELLQSDRIIESRNFAREDIQRVGERSAKLQASGVLQQVGFQFCGTDLIAPSIKLGTTTLAHNQALLVTSQVFAFNGKRDALRVRVRGEADDRPVEVTGSIPIKSEFAKNTYIFPLRGVWFVGNGASFHTPHRWAIPEEFALDIAKLGDNGLSHKGDGTKFEDYFAYGAEVLAAADGRVISTANDQPEDQSTMQRPDETADAYSMRLQKEQGERLAKGAIGLTGNYVLIDHGKNEYSMYAHLQPGSVRIHAGDQVKAGTAIGKLGSSGNSTEPHLHFQVCDKPDPLMCAGVPVNFRNVTVEWADAPRPIQSGDVVTAK
jgi:murein DD-endopeptidase MepM/ murein hydrolase activator NlpD